MQTHSEKTGPLDEGADYNKKEGGLRVLTRQGVNKVAEMLRQRRQEGAGGVLPAAKVETADAEKKEEGGAPAPAGPPRAMVLRQQNLPNRRLLRCLVGDKDASVVVRDTGYYRQGEMFEVRRNDRGEWEAAVHRTQPKFR